MKSTLVEIGSEVIALIPRELWAELKIDAGDVDVSVEGGRIVILPLPKKNPREGWAESAKRLVAEGGSGLIWPELGEEPSEEWVWPGLDEESERR